VAGVRDQSHRSHHEIVHCATVHPHPVEGDGQSSFPEAARVVAANELGLWHANDGKLDALVNVGPANPREFAEVTSTTDVLTPLATATGGDARRIEASSGVNMPRVLAVRSSDTFHGDEWIGLNMRDASVVRGIGVLPMFAGLLGLLLLVGSLAATWLRDGR
jgi:hypothetical protein